MIKKMFFCVVLTILFLTTGKGQGAFLDIKGYGEIYYQADFLSREKTHLPDFVVNHKKTNTLGLNLLGVSAAYKKDRIRTEVGVMVGDYATYNLSEEPVWARFIQKANVGYKLFDKKNIWIDGGVFNSHIGFESALGNDCWTSTRSLLAENSPYYESGLKISYQGSSKNIFLSALVLNGWQKTSPLESSSFLSSGGVQISFNPFKNVFFNYSNFFGKNNKATHIASIRTYHNVYLIINKNLRWHFLLGFDIGSDKNNKGEGGCWLSPIGMIKYIVNPKSSVVLRGEFFKDDKNIIIDKVNNNNGVLIGGGSINYDISFWSHYLLRLEIKKMYANEGVWLNGNRDHVALTGVFCVFF